MIPFPKNLVILIIAFLAILGIDIAFGFGDIGESNIYTLIPIVVIVELIIYAGTSLISNSSLSLAFIGLYSFALVILRAVLALLGAILGELIGTGGITGEINSLLGPWVGNPGGIILQVFIILIASPHILEMLFPGLFDAEFSKSLGSNQAPARTAAEKISDSNPSGGFIQVFSFEELSGVIGKTPGLDGFVIFSREGFVVWQDIPHRIQVDQFSAAVMNTANQIDDQFKSSGFSQYRKMMIESREHLVFVSELNQNFGMILIYNNRVRISDCDQKVPVLIKTAREFLQWKYPGITLAKPMKAYSA